MTLVDIATGEVMGRNAEDWARRVRAHWARSVDGIVAAGRELEAAKADLGHGNWLRMLEAHLPFSKSTAEYLMSIARNEALANSHHGGNLPASWRTLGELARIPAEQLEEAIEAGDVQPDMSRKDAKQLASRLFASPGEDSATAEQKPEPPLAPNMYRTICADPPWQYDNNFTRGAAEDHYPTLSVAQLLGTEPLPEGGPNAGERLNELVKRKAAPDGCHLYIWTTNAFLRDTFDIMEAWGFDYKATLVWVKPQMGMGNYFRISHEIVLFGVKAGLRTQANNLKSWIEADRTKHSAKPESFYRDLVVPASPGPYLEMFARPPSDQLPDIDKRPGDWEYWGNQA